MIQNSRLKGAALPLLMVLVTAYPQSTHARAGIAQFTAGDVSVRQTDGKTTALTKGGDIDSGQAIVTGPNGRAQVKFTDGGMISLQPNTEFKIANYVDQSDPKQDRFLVDLLRGSMRAITGLIGKRNRDNYKLTTTTATIGIRGSGFKVAYNPDGTLSITSELDKIEVCNQSGCIGLVAGESVRVVDRATPPVRTSQQAKVETPTTQKEANVVGDKVDETGKQPDLAKSSTPLSVKQIHTDLSVGIVSTNSTTGTAEVEGFEPGPSTPLLTSFSGGQLSEIGQFNRSLLTAQFRDTGSGSAASGALGVATDTDFVGWGSWVSGERTTSSGVTSIHSVHYVIGRATPQAQMPAAGMQGTYQFAGGTAVSSTLGAGQLTGGTLVADFGSISAGQGSASLSLNTRFGSANYTICTNLDISNSRISSSSGVNVSGFFTGNEATRAALVYSAPVAGAGQVSGAAAFERTTPLVLSAQVN